LASPHLPLSPSPLPPPPPHLHSFPTRRPSDLIYDPTLGRFLQADPFVQEPKNSQNYNRYSYVLNNPMSYTDPSGYFFKAIFKGIAKYWRVIAAAVVTYVTAGAASGWAASWGYAAGTVGNAAIAGAIAGAAGGFVATGSLKGAMAGAFSGAIF